MERVLQVDLHTHTHYSPDSIMSPRWFVETCRRKGINCVAVTDHNTIRGALAVRELADFRVIVGEEIETSAGQVLGLSSKRMCGQGFRRRRRSKECGPWAG